MTIRIRDIDHVVLRVSDLDRMLEFYRDVPGCTLERRKDDIGLVQLRAGRLRFEDRPYSRAGRTLRR
jgi:catechol 2,3-dioxygenase-like lactoylglutathione lyase family enzyme